MTFFFFFRKICSTLNFYKGHVSFPVIKRFYDAIKVFRFHFNKCLQRLQFIFFFLRTYYYLYLYLYCIVSFFIGKIFDSLPVLTRKRY